MPGKSLQGYSQGLSVFPPRAASSALCASSGLEWEDEGSDTVAALNLPFKREKRRQAA